MTELLEQLLNYRKMGMSIFPMNVIFDKKENKTQKRPAIQWAKYQKELPTEDEIRSWALKYTSFGMATGELSRIVVVDVDTDKLSDAESVLGVDLVSSMMVKTISGGTHIYYKWSEEVRNTVKIEDSPIDFRGDGGLVVIPPSKSETGNYEWLSPISDLSKTMLPELPEEIKKLLTINKNRVVVDLNAPKTALFSDGERNAASVVAIRKLMGRMPQDLWLSSGWYAFQYWCKTFCQPALDDFQIKATFDWWTRANAVADKPSVTPKSTMEVGLERIEERKYEAVAPKTGYPKLDEHMKGWIPGHLYVLTGETNSGKSALACNFLYRAWKQKKKITYFALEPDAGVIEYLAGIHHSKRWADITDNDLKLDLQGVNIFTKDSHPKLSDLLKTIATIERQDLIIVDHIGYFTNNPDDRRGKTDQESDAIKQIVGAAKRKKTAIMIIAHPRKPITNSKRERVISMNDISGSAAFKQDATDLMILHRIKDEEDIHGLTNTDIGFINLPKVKTGKPGSIAIQFIHDSPVILEENEAGDRSSQEFAYDSKKLL
jgi:archaellum biogenesis ATPase FlaH